MVLGDCYGECSFDQIASLSVEATRVRSVVGPVLTPWEKTRRLRGCPRQAARGRAVGEGRHFEPAWWPGPRSPRRRSDPSRTCAQSLVDGVDHEFVASTC